MKKTICLLIILALFMFACEKEPTSPNTESEHIEIYNKFIGIYHGFNGIPQNDFHFFDGDNGVSVGNRGSAYITTNSGLSWTLSEAPEIVNLWKVFGIDKNFWFCSSIHLSQNIMYKVENGAWLKVDIPPMPENDYIESIHFLNKDIGYISTGRQKISNNNGLVFKTVNGGITWDTVGVFGNYSVHNIHMIDENIGFVTTGAHILKTTDGWESWARVTPDGFHNVYQHPRISRVEIIDNQHLIAVGGAGFGDDKGFIITSSNGGATWEYSLINHTLRDIAITSNKIFVCGKASYVAQCDIDLSNFSSENIIANLKPYICSYDENSDFININDNNETNPWGARTEFTKIQFTDDNHGFISSNVYNFRIVLK